MKQKVTLSLFILIILWISFFPEGVQLFCENISLFFLGFIFIFLLFVKNYRRKILSIRHIPFWIFISAFLISYIFSISMKRTFNSYQYIFLISLFTYPFILNVPVKAYKYNLAKIFCVCSSLIALFGIVEFATGYNFLYETLFPNPFYEKYSSIHRAMSTQYHPSVLATYFMLSLPFGLFILSNKRNKPEFFLGMVSVVLILIGIILTFTRAVFLATFILLSIYIFIKHKKRYLVFLAIIVLFLISVIPISKHFRVFNRFDITNLKHKYSINYRLARFPTAYKIWKTQLITGVGFGNFRYLFDRYHPMKDVPYNNKIPDNMYLSILSETGILGLLALVYLVLSTIILAYKKIQVLVFSDKQFLLLIFCGFIGYLVNMLSYDMFYWHMPLYFFWIYVGIIRGYSS